MPSLFVADKIKFFEEADTLTLNSIKALAKKPYPFLNAHRG